MRMMAQYFQVVDASANTGEEVTTYSGLVENQGIHYIIQAADTTGYVVENCLDQQMIPQFGSAQSLYVVTSPQPRQQHAIQPVVLNHSLQPKVILPQRSVVMTPPARPLHRQLVAASSSSSSSSPNARASPQSAVVVNTPRAVMSNARARAVVATTSSSPSPRVVRPGASGTTGTEMVKLSDGRILTMSEYQKYIADQRQNLITNNISPVRGNTPAARPAINSSPRPTINSTPRPTINSSPQMPRVAALQQQAQRGPTAQPPRTPLPKPRVVAQPDPPPPTRAARILQTNQSARMPKFLRDFRAPPEIQNIIKNTVSDESREEYENSVRMFVLLSFGEQRLITFTTPKEDCTIQEILEQVDVAVTPDTKIFVNEINRDGIDIVVSVGFDGDDDDEEDNNENQTQPRPPSPERPETPPRLVPGKLAVCPHCGILSENFNKCARCHRKLPDDIRTVPARSIELTGKKPKKNITLNLKSPGSPAISSTSSGGTSSSVIGLNRNASNLARKKYTPRNRLQEQSDMVVTLSSDDEDDPGTPPIKRVPFVDKEPTNEELRAAVVSTQKITTTANILLKCRTIRIGSYKFTSTHDVIVCGKDIVIKSVHLKRPQDSVSVVLNRKHIVRVLSNFMKTVPAVIIYVMPVAAEMVRRTLGMSEDGFYYDPTSENETHRRIVLLPLQLTESDKGALQAIFGDLIVEISQYETNALLLRSCTQEIAHAILNNTSTTVTTSGVKQLMIYPPGKGGITINTEDYMCLERDQFLNDVIIDFYLKYMVDQLPAAQRDRVQVFSTFFYTRLTTKPKIIRKAPEIDCLTPAQKRHARVKNWTKNIDLFEKDFIIIPINENAHWFLAIICFPGLNGPKTFDGVSISKEQCIPKKIPKVTTPSATPVKINKVAEIADDSDKDEADGDESEFDIDDCDDATAASTTTAITKSIVPLPIRQPCILIFDSLGAAGRSRVTATLRDYLTCEYASKKTGERIFTKDVIAGSCPKIPQQNNYTDCGLYLLQYAEEFIKRPIRDYRLPIKTLKDWFPESVVTRKREDITDLIKQLMVKYKKDVTILPNIMLPTLNGELIDQATESEGATDDAVFEEKEGSDGNNSIDELSKSEMSQTSSNGDAEAGGAANSRESTMSYLKAKRIVKVKSDSPSLPDDDSSSGGSSSKKMKIAD